MARKKRIKPYFGRGRTINAGHPIYVIHKEQDKKEYIGMTHAKITKGIKNFKLNKNPNPKDSTDAYFRPAVDYTTEKINKKYVDWKLDPSDKPKVKRIISQNKKR